MSKNKFKFNQLFLKVFIEKDLNNFSIVEWRDACIKECSEEDAKDPRKVYKKVYRQVLRMLKNGLLKKTANSRSRSTTYSKTELFHATQFENCSHTELLIASDSVVIGHSAKNRDIISKLKEKVRQYQVEILSCVGESEEYMRLYKDFPTLKEQLEPKYLQARERSSKLLGQIKAIESVLSQFSQPPTL